MGLSWNWVDMASVNELARCGKLKGINVVAHQGRTSLRCNIGTWDNLQICSLPGVLYV